MNMPSIATPMPHGAPTVPPSAGRRSRRWPWVLLALVVLFVASAVGGVLALGGALEQALGSVDITVDGEPLLTVPRGEAAWWAVAAAVVAALAVLVVVPLSVLLALLVATLVLVVALAAALAATLLALSPLWVMALLLWLALRPRRASGSAGPSGTRPEA